MTNITTKDFFAKDGVKAKFNELLGKQSTAFITSVLQVCNSNDMLSKAEPTSVFNAAAMAATLNLPINNNLGFAYIVPYNQKQTNGQYLPVAQFQMGYKGFIQLAQRSGQVKKIYASEIYENEISKADPLNGYEFDFSKRGTSGQSKKVVGYAARLELINGFESTLYMTTEQLESHGQKFSQTYKKGFGVWKDDFDGMAKKTVIKLLLAKYAPLTVDVQNAIIADQSVINDVDTMDTTYIDNVPEVPTIDLEAAKKGVSND